GRRGQVGAAAVGWRVVVAGAAAGRGERGAGEEASDSVDRPGAHAPRFRNSRARRKGRAPSRRGASVVAGKAPNRPGCGRGSYASVTRIARCGQYFAAARTRACSAGSGAVVIAWTLPSAPRRNTSGASPTHTAWP